MGFREALELYTASRAAVLRQAEHLAELQDTIENMRAETNRIAKAKSGNRSLDELSNLDVEFHRIIFKAAGNQFVSDRFERANILKRMMTLTFSQGSIPKDLITKENTMLVFEEHLAIYEAIRRQDGDEARNAMARHIENLSAKYMRWMRAKPIVKSETFQVAFL